MVEVFDAPPELVFRNWTRAEDVATWFAPDPFRVTLCDFDARVGTRWRVEYRSESGPTIAEYGEFLEVVAPERLVFTLTQEEPGRKGPETVVTVSLRALGAKTEMSFRQTGFESAARRDGNADGWRECLQKLAANLAAHELSDLFAAWSDASTRKDLDASMRPIAEHCLSYEHQAPLVYRGVRAIRESCKRGFEATAQEFRWDVPDLKIVVHGDLAITWGLNRMRGTSSDGTRTEVWSRGTRVFQKRDGVWKMIHQHVSFPFDPETLAARMDLAP